MAVQDAPGVTKYADVDIVDLGLYNYVLSKAKFLGIHTDMYKIANVIDVMDDELRLGDDVLGGGRDAEQGSDEREVAKRSDHRGILRIGGRGETDGPPAVSSAAAGRSW